MQKLSKNWHALHENHVLLVTTNSNERSAMLDMLTRHQKLITGSVKQRAYLGHIDETLVVVLDGDGGFASEDAATRFALRYLQNGGYPTPSMVLIGGVCWGNPSQVEVGDVIICNAIESANRSTARPEGNETQFYRFDSTIELARLEASIEPTPKYGDLISLEVRLSDEKARDKLLEQKPSALGGEMEAFALIPECQNFPWLVVKAVSDLATVIEGREEQTEAACRAAAVVRGILKSFQATRQTDQQERTKTAATNLIHALNGKIVSICLDQFHAEEDKFTSALQKLHANQILVSTATLTNAVAVAPNLPEEITSLLLEIASNAFRHGRAKNISIQFGGRTIKYKDDATAFDLNNLRSDSGRGGHFTFKQFHSRHINSGSVEVKSSSDSKGNTVIICMPHDIANFPKIVDQCSARFDFTKSCRRPSLNWPAECGTVFIDLDKLNMMSVIFDVCDEITAAVNNGVNFVLHCTDDDRISEIVNRYSDSINLKQIRFVPAL